MASQTQEEQDVTVASKDDVFSTATSIHDSVQDHEALLTKTEPAPELAWQPGFKPRFPWLSLACLCGVIFSSVGAVLVLWRADGQPADIWNKRLRPNVILTILNSVSSICITTAVGQAVAIAWWRRALRGCTVQELHYSWSFSTSFSAIFTEHKYFNFLALAALMTKFTLIDGILFQQSLFSESRLSFPRERNFTGYATTEFPYTAVLYANDTKTFENSFGLFDNLLPWQYSSNEIYQSMGFQECSGVCAANFTTIGFTVNCNTISENVDIVAKISANKTNRYHWPVFGINYKTFAYSDSNNSTHKNSKNYSYIQVEVTTYKRRNRTTDDSEKDCPAMLEKNTCELRPALINYPVAMQTINTSTTVKGLHDVKTKVMLGKIDEDGLYDGDVRYWRSGMTQLYGFELNRTLDFPDVAVVDGLTRSRLAGITQAMNDRYGSQGFLYAGTGDWEMAAKGLYANVEWAQNDKYDRTLDGGATDGYCPQSYGDPMGEMIFSLNTLMFILSDDLQNRADYNRTRAYRRSQTTLIKGSEMLNEVHYIWQSNFTVGGVALTIFSILCVLPAYWGFWELGRQVTLGPFEIANAFEAPALAYTRPGDGQVEAVLEAAGQDSVRYVVRDDDPARRCLRFELQGKSVDR